MKNLQGVNNNNNNNKCTKVHLCLYMELHSTNEEETIISLFHFENNAKTHLNVHVTKTLCVRVCEFP